ncbi:hypothetical protein N0Y54_35620 [Nostoc punctiforme UO1]|uniref:hypothetical protein n=1 Tax=Nostoc punctiforme TaxID=272131 RepID=UPI0030A02BB4
MSIIAKQQELFVEIPSDQQQHLSGGRRKRDVQGNPDIRITGNLTTPDGDQIPILVLGFRLDQLGLTNSET